MVHGIYPTLATPLTADLTIDFSAFVAHAKTLLADGASGVVVLGWAGEPHGFSIGERLNLVDAAAEAGITGERLMVGVGTSNIEDTVTLARAAIAADAIAVSIAPPYSLQPVAAEGLFRFYAEIVERVGDERLHVFLDHIPALCGVAIDDALVVRLREAYPGVFVGLSDGTRDWSHAEAWCGRYEGFAVLASLDTRAIEAFALGAAGLTGGTLNLTMALVRRILAGDPGDNALDLQARLAHECSVLMEQAPIPAIKSLLAKRYGNDDWRLTMPPLCALDAGAVETLATAFATHPQSSRLQFRAHDTKVDA